MIGTSDALRRLAVLLPPGADVPGIGRQLRLSRDETDRLGRMMAHGPTIDVGSGPLAWRRQIYQVGSATFLDRLLLQAARAGGDGDEGWREAYDYANAWVVPTLPVRGTDVLALGIAAGAVVGQLVRAVEQWWIGTDFEADRAACLAALAAEARARGLA